MNPNRDLFERRQFWPRPGRPEALGEIEFDQPCSNCGYNLRGLPPDAPCPECGSRGGLNLSDEPIPWDEKQSIIAFVATVFMTIFHPHELARQLWRPVRLNLRAARKFRFVCLCVAAPTLGAMAWSLTRAAVGTDQAWLCLPFDLAGIVIWLNAATLEPMRFFRQQLSYRIHARVETISHYASAPLVLVPLHAILLLATYRTAQAPGEGWLIAAAMHFFVLLATMSLGTLTSGWLLYETVELPKLTALMYPLGAALSSVATGVVMLIGVPAFTASIVSRVFS